jgi:hypothetical protein
MKPARILLLVIAFPASLIVLSNRPQESHNSKITPKSPPLTMATSETTSQAAKARLVNAYGKLPLSFEVNQGQTDRRVKFLSRGHGYTLFLTPTEAVLALSKSHGQAEPKDPIKARVFEREKIITTALRIKLVGGNPHARLAGMEELPGRSNYFIGNDPKKWRTNVPSYAKVRYRNVYAGVDVVYYGNQRQLEHDFIVAPGADPRAITMAIAGAKKVSIDAQGELVLTSAGGEVHLRKPVIYQRAGGVQYEIAGGYKLKRENRVGFELGEYDVRLPLVIDPVLAYSTYLGGSDVDRASGIAVDSAGNAYVTGQTVSTNFPTTPGGFQTSLTPGGFFDGFVTKVNSTGTVLLYSTYFGGSGQDEPNGIAVDSAGNAYMTGFTGSSNFPTTPGAFQTSFGGGDAFVTKLNSAGTALLYSTYLGPGEVVGFGIAVDSAGSAYVTGHTNSPNFPTTSGAFQTSLAGPESTFVTKLNSTGTALLYSTYLGGVGAQGNDAGQGIAVDTLGNAYVVGSTSSPNFPITPGAFQTSFSGGFSDAFVTELNSTGTALVYSTYLGGNAVDFGFGIAVDSAGNAYVTGSTDSSNFPTTPGAFQACCGGGFNAFVTKLNSTGTALLYSTYLFGSGPGAVNPRGISVDSAGDAYVVGFTSLTTFPRTPDAMQITYGGGFADAFVTKLNPTGTALLYSTYLGGSGGDEALGIAVDSAGNAYVAGFTTSTDFPATPGALQTTYGGGIQDAFLAKISFNLPPVAVVIGAPSGPVECANHSGALVTLDGSASHDPDGDTLTFAWTEDSNPVGGNTPTLTVTVPLGTHTFALTVTDPGGLSNTATTQVTAQDTTPPTLMLSTANITVTLPTASASGASVSLAGIASAMDVCDPNPAITNNAPSLFPIGLTTVTFTATDHSGNSAQKTMKVNVVYNFTGYFTPLLNAGSALFKSGRTVPVKFQLTPADGSFVTNAIANIQVFQVLNTPTGTVDETVNTLASGSSDTGTLFKYDYSSNQYIYNLSTANYASGTYLLRTTLNDGTTHDVQFSIKW